MTYPPEDFRPEETVEHRSARCLLSAFAIALGLFALPLMTTVEELGVLILCSTIAGYIMVSDLIWVVKWVISQHTSQRDDKK